MTGVKFKKTGWEVKATIESGWWKEGSGHHSNFALACKIAHIVGRIEMKRLRRSLENDQYHINSVRLRLQRA